jgi:pyridinium-3,5-bisthiocarboxylic acid mononucleotide nickel chelatase
MKVAYFDCASGISGDMTLGAMVDAGVDLARLNAAIGSLGLPGCRLVAEEVRKRGFRATQVKVLYEPEHAHRHLSHILKLIACSMLSDRQKEFAERIFRRLAEAEAKVHGVGVDEVHFHEVGAADSIADIVGTAVGFDLLGIERLVASPVATGSGKVRIAHGLCSVPAPATAELLRGIPLAESTVEAELTTPTGAAILAALADSFGSLPPMIIDRIGCGAGQRDLDQQPNILRLMIGDSTEKLASTASAEDRVWVLETNLDDLSGEMIGYCTNRLWDAGALDVFTTAIQMKKNRPGVTLSVLCPEENIEPIEAILFEETTTLGIRRWPASRHILARQSHSVETSWGPIEGKVAWLSDGTPRFAPEFESCRKAAETHAIALRAVYEAAQRAFDPATVDGRR